MREETGREGGREEGVRECVYVPHPTQDDDGAATAGELMAVDQPSPSSNDDDRETKQEATPPSQPVSGEEKEK